MSKEFGIYPNNSVPHYWIGCRAIITRGQFDIPWDRWSSEFIETTRKDELVEWVNETALTELKRRVKAHNNRGYFDSTDGKFRCEYDDKSSGGYLYAGFYSITIEEGDMTYEK